MAIPKDELRRAYQDLSVEPLTDPSDPRYVPHSAASNTIQAIRSRLNPASGRGQIIFFSGHRGTGKSTELHRLANQLADEYTPIHLTIKDFADPANFGVVDYLLAIGSAIARAEPQKTMARQFRSLTIDLGLAAMDSVAFWPNPTLRAEIREKTGTRLQEMLTAINADLAAMAKQGKAPVLVVDDLDKLSVDQALALYQGLGANLDKIACSSIHCVPLAMLQSPEIALLPEYHVEILRVLQISSITGELVQESVDVLSSMITRRVPSTWFAEGSLAALAEASGGVLRDLIKLTSDCLVELEISGQNTTSRTMVWNVVNEQSVQRRITIDTDSMEALTAIHASHRISGMSPSTVASLIDRSLVLVHSDAALWYQVHPLLSPMLEGAMTGA